MSSTAPVANILYAKYYPLFKHIKHIKYIGNMPGENRGIPREKVVGATAEQRPNRSAGLPVLKARRSFEVVNPAIRKTLTELGLGIP